MKKCPSLPNGGIRWYSALPPAAVKASCMRLDSAGPKKVSFSIVDPQHRHPRRAAELTGRFHQLVWRAIVVRLAIDAAATAGGEDDDRFDLGWVQA